MKVWKGFAALMICGSCLSSLNTEAQGYVDQAAVAPLLQMQDGPVPQPVKWHIYKIGNAQKTTKAVMSKLQSHLDSLPGDLKGQRMAVVELTNRVARKYLMQKHELLVPNSFPADFRAYTPYPTNWPAAATTAKLFVIDKYTQTFGAYERGKLVHWGLVSTGKEDDKTPTGRYAFNWKQDVRLSSEAPEGETWEMKWVVNFNESRGLHVHQYSLPIAQNASHGCVRLTEADALWNYKWAEKGTPVLVLNYAPVGLASHWMAAEGNPISMIQLPDSPMDVPAGNKGFAGR